MGASHTDPVPLIDMSAQHAPILGELNAALKRVLESGQFILGEEVAALESETAAYCDAGFAIGCASGTDALSLALLSLEIGPGDEVITSPFTFFATASAIVRAGATPVFVEIDPIDFNINPAAVAAAITPRTKAIIPVHLFGQCAEMEPLWRLAVRDNLAIIEDACQAIGAEYHGRRAGVLGTMGCFSFFPTKNLGAAGDGGLITLDDPDLADRLRQLRVHGDTGGYQHVSVGLNSRLDALQAALLRVKLPQLEGWTNERIENARRYDVLLTDHGLDHLVIGPAQRPDRRHVFNQYTIRVPRRCRDQVLESLRHHGIGCAVYYPAPLHLQPCFSSLGYRAGQLPMAESVAGEVLSLPIAPGLTEAGQQAVVRRLAEALATSGELERRQAA